MFGYRLAHEVEQGRGNVGHARLDSASRDNATTPEAQETKLSVRPVHAKALTAHVLAGLKPSPGCTRGHTQGGKQGVAVVVSKVELEDDIR